MIPELGHIALITALCLALVQAVLPLVGAARGQPNWMAVARPAAFGQFAFLLLAFGCLSYAFLAHDFSVQYVAQNSNSALPWPYRLSAVWGAHEGSLLLWSLILGVWTVAVASFSGALPPAMLARVLGVMGLVSVGFLAFMLTTSNPFTRLLPAPADGRDLNPLLQDPGLVIHPPLLYMGYVGFSVAFAFAIAALLNGRLDATWARWSRPWTTAAWAFLTVGIMLGSWWAYNELGWGGWWFWDPVENASFMPWLVGTALIHSLAVTEQRGAFKAWTVLLAITAFSLSLLGTFLVRSGVLVSVHAFATDPARGVYILGFLVVVIGGSLLLYALRAPRVVGGAGFGALSREVALLGNNLLLAVAAATILLGTLYPLLLDALGLGKISVGPPYFNTVFAPLMLPLALLAGIGPWLRWKQDRWARVWRHLRWGAAVGLVAWLAAGLWMGFGRHALAAIAVGIACWLLYQTFAELGQRRDARGGWLAGWRSIPQHHYGMTLAHIGLAVFILGVALVGALGVERDVRLGQGESVTFAGYEFRFDGVAREFGPNYEARRGRIAVSRAGEPVAELWPEKRVYRVQSNPMTEAGVDAGLLRDLYVALGEPLDPTQGSAGAWSLRIYYKPFIRWIWAGALLMAAGGLVALTDRRYRLRSRVRQPARSASATVPPHARPAQAGA